MGAFLLTRTDGKVEKLPCKQGGIPLYAGDILTVLTPGGGGYGPPGERDKLASQLDLRQGKVTK